jgi:EAL domain-containing protein (putative c-di-GMP-specific phosphodiesterase class I)
MADGGRVTAGGLFELRELGRKLLVDDFGTGFSALGYLRRFPVTGVKIDRSFVSGLGESGEDEEIVRAVVAMSRALGLSIVAEGVETRVQRDALGAVGVTQGQGWLWGPGWRRATSRPTGALAGTPPYRPVDPESEVPSSPWGDKRLLGHWCTGDKSGIIPTGSGPLPTATSGR